MRCAQARLSGELKQELQRLVSDAILGIVEIDSDIFDREALAPLGVIGEELAELQPLDLLVVGLESGPSRTLAQSGDGHRQWSSIK